ncbi:hypothetical protein [Bacillus pumilus]|uniref:hypothetical protein n=1 Tax=Bacillus pumilus TaxID=1408 RepID=UPI0011A3A29D
MEEEELKGDLSKRHVELIGIGGRIGSGVFLGCGKVIELGGGWMIFAYLIVGMGMFLVMRGVGEVVLWKTGYE